MERDEIESIVQKLLYVDFELENDLTNPATRLKEDLGIGSLDLLNLIVAVDKYFGIRIYIEDLYKIQTLAQFYDYIESKVNGNGQKFGIPHYFQT